MNRNLLRPLLPLLLAVATGQAWALADDRDQPITLKADRVEINQRSGISRYEGGVELRQGSLHISATRIVVRRSRHEVTHIEADGNPVTIRQRPTPDQEETRAEARHIDYDLKQGVVRLTGQAHVWQEGNEFSGETITYEDTKGVVTADGNGSDPQQKGRVEMVIQPRKEPTP